MAYYVEDELTGAAIGKRRPTINEYFLSSYTLAVYDGCEFGCPYCDGWAYRTRPFNETVRVAVNLVDKVAEDLEQIDRGDLVAITALSDPYQPAEASYRLTRQILRLFAERGQPCLILTKSPTVLEDLVLLEQINAKSLAAVVFTVLGTDPYLCSKLEDKAPPPQLRLEAIAALKQAGIPTGVAMMPITPYVNDTDYSISMTVKAVAEAGADFLVWDYLHIPSERHRKRISDMLARIGSYPPSYYRDLYSDGQGPTPLPGLSYRADRDREIMARCDAANLPTRPPHRLFAGKLAPQNEAALLLKHTAFRDTVQGRGQSAALNSELADMVYQGVATDAQLRRSPLYGQLNALLGPRRA
ncbi:radical SAM protein [Chloroflexia bacterium SDU3-3]|nr:radical SAM protein [Chloroflexia bacterium SDU3-3]